MNRLQLKIEENFSLIRKEKQTSFGGSSSIWKELTYGTKISKWEAWRSKVL